MAVSPQLWSIVQKLFEGEVVESGNVVVKRTRMEENGCPDCIDRPIACVPTKPLEAVMRKFVPKTALLRADSGLNPYLMADLRKVISVSICIN